MGQFNHHRPDALQLPIVIDLLRTISKGGLKLQRRGAVMKCAIFRIIRIAAYRRLSDLSVSNFTDDKSPTAYSIQFLRDASVLYQTDLSNKYEEARIL